MMKWFQEYKKSLKMIEVEEVLDLILYRPLAFLFVKLIYKSNITPNQITIFALFAGVLSGVVYSMGTHSAYITAAMLLIVKEVLDCADGQLARLKKNGTLTGRLIDGFSDYAVSIAIYVGIGLGFASNSTNPILYWILTVLAGFSNALHSFILDYYRNNFMDNVLGRTTTLGADLNRYRTEYPKLMKKPGKYFDKAMLWLYIRYSSTQIKFSSSSSEVKRYDPEDYYNKNKLALHLWTYLGPTTEFIFLIMCSIGNRLDIFLWGMVIVANLVAAILYIYQKRITLHLKPVEVN